MSVVSNLGIGEPLRRRTFTSMRNWKDGGTQGTNMTREKLTCREKGRRNRDVIWIARKNLYAYVATREGGKDRG
jgi:hypothetical protein